MRFLDQLLSFDSSYRKVPTGAMKIRKSLYSGHLHLMWGASKMKEKALEETPVEDKLGSLRSEASHRSSLNLGQEHNVTFRSQSPYLTLD